MLEGPNVPKGEAETEGRRRARKGLQREIAGRNENAGQPSRAQTGSGGRGEEGERQGQGASQAEDLQRVEVPGGAVGSSKVALQVHRNGATLHASGAKLSGSGGPDVARGPGEQGSELTDAQGSGRAEGGDVGEDVAQEAVKGGAGSGGRGAAPQ
jgi:hypothetical protein